MWTEAGVDATGTIRALLARRRIHLCQSVFDHEARPLNRAPVPKKDRSCAITYEYE
jgi:hypothetical protein